MPRRLCKFTKRLQDIYDMFEKTEELDAAKCTICDRIIKIGHQGANALEDHLTTQRHIENAQDQGIEIAPKKELPPWSESESGDDDFYWELKEEDQMDPAQPTKRIKKEGGSATKHIDKKKFSHQWLNKDWSNGWLAPYDEDELKARCLCCEKILRAGKSELFKHSQSYQHQKMFNTFCIENNITAGSMEKAFTNDRFTVKAKLEKSSNNKNKITITKLANRDSIPPNIETVFVQPDFGEEYGSSGHPTPERRVMTKIDKHLLLLKKRKFELENENLQLQNIGQKLQNEKLKLEIMRMKEELGLNRIQQENNYIVQVEDARVE